MINNIPIDWVHKSHSATMKRCSEQLYLKDILKLKPEFVNESAVAGSAFHSFTEEIYKSKRENKWDDLKYWLTYFVNRFDEEKEKYLSQDINFNTAEDIKVEDYAEMIGQFLKAEWNRKAEPILIEAPFRFVITRHKNEYPVIWDYLSKNKIEGLIDRKKKIILFGYEGRIDQLLRHYWADLPKHFKEQLFKLYYDLDSPPIQLDKPYIYLHRDIKTGQRRTKSEIELATDDNIMYYSYALAYGLFDLDGDGIYERQIRHVPFAHALYYTRDHLTYKRKYTHKNGLVSEVGDPKGQAMYFVRKTLDDLKYMEEELIKMWIRINFGPYTRDGAASSLCDRFCAFKKMCLHDFLNPITEEYKVTQ